MNSHKTRRSIQTAVAFVFLLAACGGASDEGNATASNQPSDDLGTAAISEENLSSDPDMSRIDYLTFAQGAVPISIGGPGAEMGPDAENQIQWIDGDPTPRGFNRTTDMEVVTEFTYQLPAPTTFDRFAVPHVLEVPGSRTTFTRYVEVHGSSVGPDEGYVMLASATLVTQPVRGQVQELSLVASPAVRWIKLVLQGGIEILEDEMFFEFSEIVGNGTQDPKPFVENFMGAWDSRTVKMELQQDGVLVNGCYDIQGELEGTVEGNILKARGVDMGGAQTVSLFILAVLEDGSITGVRSTNGSPFRLYTGPSVDDVPRLSCGEPEPPALGCGSVIHGINFGFDSAEILPASEPILEELFAGLDADESASIVIEGHTSSEGSDSYNQTLSEQRAQAVVDDLVRRGIEAGRLSSAGKGEAEPIAPNSDENGRSLNRRVEVECS